MKKAAPMAWQGKTVGAICIQLKDRKRNRDIAANALLLWAWNPGPGRTPARGGNEAFRALLQAWAETGAKVRSMTGCRMKQR